MLGGGATGTGLAKEFAGVGGVSGDGDIAGTGVV
jgi:hypothetical protein